MVNFLKYLFSNKFFKFYYILIIEIILKYNFSFIFFVATKNFFSLFNNAFIFVSGSVSLCETYGCKLLFSNVDKYNSLVVESKLQLTLN